MKYTIYFYLERYFEPQRMSLVQVKHFQCCLWLTSGFILGMDRFPEDVWACGALTTASVSSFSAGSFCACLLRMSVMIIWAAVKSAVLPMIVLACTELAHQTLWVNYNPNSKHKLERKYSKYKRCWIFMSYHNYQSKKKVVTCSTLGCYVICVFILFRLLWRQNSTTCLAPRLLSTRSTSTVRTACARMTSECHYRSIVAWINTYCI